MRTNEKGIAQWLIAQDDVVIVTHHSPDGDALGSSLAMMWALQSMGKRACVVCQDEVPMRHRALPGWEQVVQPDALPFAPRAVFVMDCGDEGRVGNARSLLEVENSAMVDHHASNTGFTPLWYLDADASATGEITLRIFTEMGIALTKEMADCLYVAISTDTGNFAFSCVSGDTFRAAGRLCDAGADVVGLNFAFFRRMTQARVHLMGRALAGLTYLDGGTIALMRLSLQDFAETGAVHSDTENLVNYGMETDGVLVAIQATEQENSTRFSLRSRGAIDVSKVACALGGGGHEAAAGATLPLPMNEAVEKVLSEVRRALG